MKQKKVFLLWFFLCLGFFLFSTPLYVYSQFRDTDEGRFSLEKTGVTDIIEKVSGDQGKSVYADKEIKYVAGADNQWFTADDEVYHYFLTERDKKGRMLKKLCYTIGKDSLAFTADDELQEYQVYGYNKQQKAEKEITFNSPGPDEKWFTADDAQKYRAVYEYDSRGNKSREVRYNDTKEVIYYTVFEYNKQGWPLKDVDYSGDGADNKWFSSDDRIEKYHQREFDAYGKLLRAREYHSQHNGMGKDEVWFNADDVVSAARELLYNDLGQVVKTKKYIGSGPDNQWFTVDDILQYYTVRLYNKDFKQNNSHEDITESIH
ncbi:MAG: hypothetical protein WDL87_04830 [Candidatus Omnitrophota bacterium]